jgi:Flp pilus assembly protein TadD
MNAEELFDDANGDLALGELGAAAEKYRRCIELAPDYADAWHALAMAQMKLGRHSEAIEAALKYTELRPNEQLAWSTLSICYVKNGQIKEAESAGGKSRILGWGGKIQKES